MALINIANLRIGDKVHYQPKHYKEADKWENGIIKEIQEENLDGVWVVYNCGDNWNNYKDYTSALTNLRDLKLHWRFE